MNSIIADLDDFRKESIMLGKCLICNRPMHILFIKEAVNLKRKRDMFIELNLISFNRDIEAFINYNRDFEYERWIEEKQATKKGEPKNSEVKG